MTLSRTHKPLDQAGRVDEAILQYEFSTGYLGSERCVDQSLRLFAIKKNGGEVIGLQGCHDL